MTTFCTPGGHYVPFTLETCQGDLLVLLSGQGSRTGTLQISLLTSRFFKKFKLICLLVATTLSMEEDGGTLQTGLHMSFYTKWSKSKQTDFKYHMMRLSKDGGEDWEISHVKWDAECLTQNRSGKKCLFYELMIK